MPLASSQYDIVLNSVGYILLEESYRKKAQPPFNARFSTGDPSLGDLSFWQFIGQTHMLGGQGQLNAFLLTMTRSSEGWSFLQGKPALAGTVVNGATCTALPTTLASLGWGSVFLRMDVGSQKNQVILIGTSAGAAGGISTLRNTAGATVGVKQIDARSACIWDRSSLNLGSYLACAIAGNLIRIYDSAGTNTVDLSTVDSVKAYALDVHLVIPINFNHLLAIGTVAGRVAGAAYSVGTDNFTVTENSVSVWTGMPWSQIVPTYAIDSSGSMYFATTYPELTDDHGGSAIGIITAADGIQATALGPNLSSKVYLPDFIVGGLGTINGTVYIFGARVYRSATGGGAVSYAPCVMKYPGTVIWESEKRFTDATCYGIIRAVSQASPHEIHFAARNNEAQLQSFFRLKAGDIVEEIGVVAIDASASSGKVPASLVKVGKKMIVCNAGNTQLVEAIDGTSSSRPSATHILRTSFYGANTNGVSKTLYSVTVRLTAPIPVGETMTIKVNGTTLGTITSTSGTATSDGGVEVELVAATEITGKSFSVSFEIPSTATWTGAIEDYSPLCRFIPTQFKKRAWGFGCRLTNNLKLSDGTRETKLPSAQITNLEAAWASNTPVTFKDVDGQSYTVIVTDFDQRRPLLQRKGGKNLEAFVFVELLEV